MLLCQNALLNDVCASSVAVSCAAIMQCKMALMHLALPLHGIIFCVVVYMCLASAFQKFIYSPAILAQLALYFTGLSVH